MPSRSHSLAAVCPQVRRQDVLSAWSGIRPLASDPNASDTASISRDHVITTDASGLVTVSGGKWTTYRKMAEEAVDEALAGGAIEGAGPSATEALPLVGTPGWSRAYHAKIAQNYVVPHRPGAIDTRVSNKHGLPAPCQTRLDERVGGKRLNGCAGPCFATVLHSFQRFYLFILIP